MWNIAFEGLLDLFPDEGRVNIVGYADDACLIVSGPSPKYLVRLMQKAVDAALAWGARNSLHFAPKKTYVVLFTRCKVDPNLEKITVGGLARPFLKEVTYLGLILDSRLLWLRHVYHKIGRAKALLLLVRNASGKLWGLHPRMAIWHYRAIVPPMISYGSIVWCRAALAPRAKKALTKLQRMALISMGHFRQGTPTAGLEAIMFTTPLWLHIVQEGAMAYLRTQGLTKLPRDVLHVAGHKPLTVGHRQVLEKFLSDIGLANRDTDTFVERRFWDKLFRIDSATFQAGRLLPSGDLDVYTDGSKDDNGNTGSAFVVYGGPIPSFEGKWPLGTGTSVFQAEVFALKKAAEHLYNTGVRDRRVRIYSDSRAALLALKSSKVSSHVVEQTMMALNLLAVDNDVTLCWVKAHVGHEGNERADRLAKEATEADFVEPSAPLESNKVLREDLREKVVAHWQDLWTNLGMCRQTKHFFGTLSRYRSAEVTHYSRVKFSVLVQFMTGFNFMGYHNCLVANNGVCDPVEAECTHCHDGLEDSHHILAECAAFLQARVDCFGQHFLVLPFSNFKIRFLVKFIKATGIRAFADMFQYNA